MATKPPDNLPEWADGSNGGAYTGGPFAGQPRKVSIPNGIAAEGYRPGKNDPSTSEHLNDYQNKMSLFHRWVYAGSALPLAERSIVERATDGKIAGQWAEFRADESVVPYSLGAQAPTDSGNAASFYSEGPNTDTCVVIYHDSGIGLSITSDSPTDAALVAGVTELTGDSVRPALTCNSSADLSACIIGNHTTGDGDGVLGVGSGTGVGINGFAGGSGAGVKGNSTTGVGVLGSSSTAAEAVSGANSSTGSGVKGTSTGGSGVRGEGPIGMHAKGTSTTGDGLYAETAIAATNVAAAIRARPTADATGVDSMSVTGPAGVFNGLGSGADGIQCISGSARAAYFDGNNTKCTTVHKPATGDPSSPEDGGMWYRDNVGMKVRREGVTRTLCDSPGGSAFCSAGPPSTGTVTDAGSNIRTATFAGADIPAVAGKVIIRFTAEIGRDAGTPNAQIQLTHQGVVSPVDEIIQLFQAAGTYERHIAYEVEYTLPGAGAATFLANLKSTDAGDDINYRNCCLTVTGVY